MQLPKWLSLPHFEQSDLAIKAKNLRNILVSIFLFEIIFGILTPFVFPENPTEALVFIGLSILYTIGCFILLIKRRLLLSSLLFCIFLGFSTLGSALNSNSLDSFTIQTFTLVVLIAGLLLGPRYGLSFAIFGSITIILLYFVEITGVIVIPKTSFPILLKIAIPAFVFVMAAILVQNITQNISGALQSARQNELVLEKTNAELKAIQATLAQRIEDRTSQLQASIAIGQTISHLLNPDDLGKQVIQNLITLFEFDYANIYMLDDTRRWAILRYTNQETLESFRVGVHRIELAHTSAITQAIRTQRAYITTDFSNPTELLTTLQSRDIHTEITLPLQTRGNLLGALNLQAYEVLVFGSQDIDTLQNVADQIASAFENARLFNETQKQFQEINRLNQFYLQTTWRALLTEEIPAFEIISGELKEMQKSDHNALRIAQKEQRIHLSTDNGSTKLVAPIMFQDQVLGAIQLTTQDRTWTTDELALIEAVLNQTALSLENTRLIVETRSRADQEKMISEISSRMRETLDLETILQTTAQEMQKTFQLSEVEIRLLPQQEPPEYQPSASGQ